MRNIVDWAEDELSDYPTHDDVALTENERNRAIDLLLSLNVIDEEPTLVLTGLKVTDVQLLQTGLFLVSEVLKHRHDRAVREDDDQVGREILDSLTNVRKLYTWLENKKESK